MNSRLENVGLRSDKHIRAIEDERRALEHERRANENERRANEDERRALEAERTALEEKARADEEKSRHRDELLRDTTFIELIRQCHESLSKSMTLGTKSKCTRGPPHEATGKVCPDRFEHWSEFSRKQDDIYSAVCKFLEPTDNDGKRLFDSIDSIEVSGKHIKKNEITSEQDIELYERFAVENHVVSIIAELSKIPAAREYFHLNFEGIKYMNHLSNLRSFMKVLCKERGVTLPITSKPDSVCLWYDEEGERLVLTGEYKPPHKLPMDTLRAGLRTHNFYEEIVGSHTIPTEETERMKYKAARLAGSAIVQEYHTMILLGLEYGYVTTGLGIVLLRVPYDNPQTLQFHLCEPHMEVDQGGDKWSLRPLTAIARVLCLTLMGFGSQPRGVEWSAKTKPTLETWITSFDLTYISQNKGEQAPNDPSDKTFLPPRKSKVAASAGRGKTTRSRARCSENHMKSKREDTADPDPDSAPGQKRRLMDTTSSALPATERRSKRPKYAGGGSKSRQRQSLPFCTQNCLRGLKRRGKLDKNCPNFQLHQENGSTHHRTNTRGLAKLIKAAIDECLDRAEPMGGCGLSGAPFKLTCVRYGYTIVGKGTTCYLWPQLECEADIYRMLEPVQGSAVPVYIGKIDLRRMYFLLGAGPIRHMLLMGWGGESIDEVEVDSHILRQSVTESAKDIQSLGVQHQDLGSGNILWNSELSRAMIIDFHMCTFAMELVKKKPTWLTNENSQMELIENDQERRHCEHHGVCLHPPDGKCPNVLLDIY
ncbi:hypothetical protein ASPFODRAFT_146246 [Aspergillus luchuensis CBS 106.47]|uniref:Protein kinase domain-containing protein n=1 Tax=Aspergillus luchuensis (strain CBS 106.47) TaxID=1137211 RepID=A0A1M3T3K2_ASPLC|nr:hypothetical protein ASPFODRAFT_146246 [Aspergillus luchuensis CBS 106.47]